MSKKPTLREERDAAIAEQETAREITRLLWHWCLWHDGLLAELTNAGTMEEVEALRVGCLEDYEKWRRVRESGMRNIHSWIKKLPKESDDQPNH